MATNYTVVQYVPDPVADERVNVGIIAWNETEIKLHFVSDFKRAQRLGNVSMLPAIDQVKDYLLEIEAQPFDGSTAERIKTMVQESYNLIQFRPISITRSAPSAAVVELSSTFLKEQNRAVARTRRGSAWVNNLFIRKAETVVQKVWGSTAATVDIDHIFKPHASIEGDLTQHKTSFALQNGVLRLVGLADSMETQVSAEKQGKVMFDAQDLRRANRNVLMTCLLLPPRDPNERAIETYRNTVGLLHKLDIVTMEEDTQVESVLETTFRQINF